jgi:uncharacterized protein
LKITAAARALWLALTLCWSFLAVAQVPVPPLAGHVTDQTGTLDAAQKESLERMLTDFEARKGSQLAVLMIRTTAPEPIESFALRVAEQWKLGRKKVDDGAILVVAKDDRTVRIEVGYGLEGVLTDLTSRRIIDEVIVPRFRQQDFAGGVAAGVDRIIRVVDGEPLPAPQRGSGTGQGDASDLGDYIPLIVVLALVVGGVLRAMLGRLPGAVATGALAAVAVWWMAGALMLAVSAGVAAALFTMFGGTRWLGMGGWGGRGGSGGGGFRGGGGGFGGGGASGRWR